MCCVLNDMLIYYTVLNTLVQQEVTLLWLLITEIRILEYATQPYTER